MDATTKKNPVEHRRQPRVSIPEQVQLADAHNGQVLGQLVNLSVDGFMLVGPSCIKPGAVYQLRFALKDAEGSNVELLIGVESLWSQDANDSGSHWTGFQIIDISPQHQTILDTVVGD